MGIAFGSFAGGVAVGRVTVSAAVITGLTIAVIAVPAAWASSYRKRRRCAPRMTKLVWTVRQPGLP